MKKNVCNQIIKTLMISFCFTQTLDFLLRPISVHLFILTAKRQLNNGTGQKPITLHFKEIDRRRNIMGSSRSRTTTKRLQGMFLIVAPDRHKNKIFLWYLRLVIRYAGTFFYDLIYGPDFGPVFSTRSSLRSRLII